MALGWVVDVIGPLLTKTYIGGGRGAWRQSHPPGFLLNPGPQAGILFGRELFMRSSPAARTGRIPIAALHSLARA